ncbi:MAG: Flp pilus assembly complex ATPase component TadA [Lachnospiraceae bacterium]|nr:Flp pilus assembly complex ATPase component TadA [Lachnospiraceae bacterium]
MDSKQFYNIRIGDLLLERGYATDEQIAQAVAYQKENKGVRMGDALIRLGFITELQMLQALADKMGYRLVNVSELNVDINAVEKIPKNLAENYCMLGYASDGMTYSLLVNDPMNFYGIEDIRQIVGMELEIALCEKSSLESAISYYYSEVSAKEAASRAAVNSNYQEVVELDLQNTDDDTPIINLFNSLIIRAYNSNVSDIHIEPYEHETHVRMRMDGVIMDFMVLQKSIHNSLIARIKILSDLDIAERRIPQDGHFRTNIEGQNLNVRVSVIPTVFGEKAVLRLLASASTIDYSASFGMNQQNYELVSNMLRSPNGIIYVTGPTGSGKSTTLYMILAELSKRSVNICTIEDPVEKNLPKLNQMQVNNQAGLTFEIGLRALLRQDPDIIMVGETRDKETASISVRAAITGHLVLSTLHTNDAASSVIRLVDMGVESYMIAGSLVGVIAQRLVRKVCPACAEWGEMTDEEEILVGRRLPRVMHVKGCPKCSNTGYRGRIAIHEVLPINKQIREMVTGGATTEQLKDYAVEVLGMRTLKQEAISLVEQGITTVEELSRVSYYE